MRRRERERKNGSVCDSVWLDLCVSERERVPKEAREREREREREK